MILNLGWVVPQMEFNKPNQADASRFRKVGVNCHLKRLQHCVIFYSPPRLTEKVLNSSESQWLT